MKSIFATIALVACSALSDVAAAQSGTAPFCLQTATGARCVFGSMGDCESARGSTGSTAPGQCMTRTDAEGTTGLGRERPAPAVPPGQQPPPPGPLGTER